MATTQTRLDGGGGPFGLLILLPIRAELARGGSRRESLGKSPPASGLGRKKTDPRLPVRITAWGIGIGIGRRRAGIWKVSRIAGIYKPRTGRSKDEKSDHPRGRPSRSMASRLCRNRLRTSQQEPREAASHGQQQENASSSPRWQGKGARHGKEQWVAEWGSSLARFLVKEAALNGFERMACRFLQKALLYH